MTDRHRAEDVYVLLKKHQEWTETEFAKVESQIAALGGDEGIQTMIEEHRELLRALPKIYQYLDQLLNAVVGPVKISAATGEPRVNGNGEPIRDESQGLINLRNRLSGKQLTIVLASQAALFFSSLAVVIQVFR